MCSVCHCSSIRHLADRHHSTVSLCAHVIRCRIRSKLCRDWASIQDHVMQARSEACPKMHCTYIQASAFRLRSPKLLFDTADFEQQLGLCWHARAVKEIALADKDWVESLTLEKAYDYITDVQLQHDICQSYQLGQHIQKPACPVSRRTCIRVATCHCWG